MRSTVLFCLTGLVALGMPDSGFGQIVCPSDPHPSGPLVSIEAVAVNGVAIPATNCVQVSRGDIVEAEIRISGWGPDFLLRGYQVELAGRAGAQSGQFGSIVPLGWHAPLDTTACITHADCAFDSDLQCDLRVGFPRICVDGPEHNPYLGVFLNLGHENFVFAGFDVMSGVGLASLDAAYFAVVLFGAVAGHAGLEYYAGSLALMVGADACGTFAFDALTPNNSLHTIFIDPIGDPIVPLTAPLHIVVPSCDCNGNGVSDLEEIASGASLDCNEDEIPDECQIGVRRPCPPRRSQRLPDDSK